MSDNVEHPGLMDWFVSGEVGTSSKFIASKGIDPDYKGDGFSNYPLDPDDFQRCRKLLKRVPTLRAVLDNEVAKSHPVWGALVARWDEIDSLFQKEFEENTGRAPRTYQLMREIRSGAGE